METKVLKTNSQFISMLNLPSDTLTKLKELQGDEFKPVANEFLTEVFNKVVYQVVSRIDFQNPFQKFEGFPIEYGSTIENIFVPIPQGYDYSKLQKTEKENPFTIFQNDVKSYYATINYEMQYPLTIFYPLLKRAVLARYGFEELSRALIESLGRAKDIDKYRATIAMISNSELYKNGVQEVSYQDGEEGKQAIFKIIDTLTAYQIPSDKFNKAEVETSTKENKVVLIIKRALLNKINLEFLTGVYNLDKVNFLPKSNIIVVEEFGDHDTPSDIDFILLDENGFDIHTALNDTEFIYNPRGKYFNYFSNLWAIISFKLFANAQAYKMTQSV